MSKGKIGKNYIYNVLYEILTILVPLITTPYISRVLGADGIGIYSYTYSIAMYFTFLAALGTNVYARREIAYQQDNIEKRSLIFWEIFVFRLIFTLLSIVLYSGIVLISDYKLIAIIQSIYILTVVFDITWFFQGMEEFGKIALINAIMKVINVAYIFIFVRNSENLVQYIFGLAFMPLAGNIITWLFLKKHLKTVDIRKLKPLRHFKATISLFIPTIAAQVYLLLDKTMIGAFSVNNIENGFYEQAQKIIKICWTLLTTFATVMAPRMAFIYSKKDSQKLLEYLKKSFKIVWLISGAVSFGLLAIASNLVPWFFGSEFNKVIFLISIFSWIMIPIGLNSVIGNEYLIISKKIKPYTISIIIGALINFILNLILIPHFFSIGAAISSVIAECIIAVIQLIYIVKHEKMITYSEVFDSFWKYLISGLSMFIVVYVISMYMKSNFLNTFILIGIGAIIYIGMLIIFRENIIKELLNKVKCFFNRKKEI